MSATADAASVEDRARAILRRLFDERDPSDPRWFWAEDVAVRFHALDLTVREPDGMAAFFTELFAAVPDWRNEVEEVLGHDGAATIRWRGTGTHTFARQIGMLPKAGSAADRATLAAFNAAARVRRRVRRRG